jgi:hypothetical protein
VPRNEELSAKPLAGNYTLNPKGWSSLRETMPKRGKSGVVAKKVHVISVNSLPNPVGKQ